MAESRRVHLTTLAHYVPPSSFTSEAREAKTQPGRPADPDTVRLVLNLFEPDEQSFPEFSYSQLVDGKVGLGLCLIWKIIIFKVKSSTCLISYVDFFYYVLLCYVLMFYFL